MQSLPELVRAAVGLSSETSDSGSTATSHSISRTRAQQLLTTLSLLSTSLPPASSSQGELPFFSSSNSFSTVPPMSSGIAVPAAVAAAIAVTSSSTSSSQPLPLTALLNSTLQSLCSAALAVLDLEFSAGAQSPTTTATSGASAAHHSNSVSASTSPSQLSSQTFFGLPINALLIGTDPTFGPWLMNSAAASPSTLSHHSAASQHSVPSPTLSTQLSTDLLHYITLTSQGQLDAPLTTQSNAAQSPLPHLPSLSTSTAQSARWIAFSKSPLQYRQYLASISLPTQNFEDPLLSLLKRTNVLTSTATPIPPQWSLVLQLQETGGAASAPISASSSSQHWDWELILSLLSGPIAQFPHAFQYALQRRWIHRLFDFFTPPHQQQQQQQSNDFPIPFHEIDHSPHTMILVRCALQLLRLTCNAFTNSSNDQQSPLPAFAESVAQALISSCTIFDSSATNSSAYSDAHLHPQCDVQLLHSLGSVPSQLPPQRSSFRNSLHKKLSRFYVHFIAILSHHAPTAHHFDRLGLWRTLGQAPLSPSQTSPLSSSSPPPHELHAIALASPLPMFTRNDALCRLVASAFLSLQSDRSALLAKLWSRSKSSSISLKSSLCQLSRMFLRTFFATMQSEPALHSVSWTIDVFLGVILSTTFVVVPPISATSTTSEIDTQWHVDLCKLAIMGLEECAQAHPMLLQSLIDALISPTVSLQRTELLELNRSNLHRLPMLIALARLPSAMTRTLWTHLLVSPRMLPLLAPFAVPLPTDPKPSLAIAAGASVAASAALQDDSAARGVLTPHGALHFQFLNSVEFNDRLESSLIAALTSTMPSPNPISTADDSAPPAPSSMGATHGYIAGWGSCAPPPYAYSPTDSFITSHLCTAPFHVSLSSNSVASISSPPVSRSLLVDTHPVVTFSPPQCLWVSQPDSNSQQQQSPEPTAIAAPSLLPQLYLVTQVVERSTTKSSLPSYYRARLCFGALSTPQMASAAISATPSLSAATAPSPTPSSPQQQQQQNLPNDWVCSASQRDKLLREALHHYANDIDPNAPAQPQPPPTPSVVASSTPLGSSLSPSSPMHSAMLDPPRFPKRYAVLVTGECRWVFEVHLNQGPGIDSYLSLVQIWITVPLPTAGSPSVLLPPHPIGQLARHAEGRDRIKSSDFFANFNLLFQNCALAPPPTTGTPATSAEADDYSKWLDVSSSLPPNPVSLQPQQNQPAQAAEAEAVITLDDDISSERRAALWAVGSIGATDQGFQWLKSEFPGIIDTISEHAHRSATLSIRGLCSPFIDFFVSSLPCCFRHLCLCARSVCSMSKCSLGTISLAMDTFVNATWLCRFAGAITHA